MRLRYSLRTALVLLTLAALLCGWLALPTYNANRFVRAVEAQNLAAADRMLARDDAWRLTDLGKVTGERTTDAGERHYFRILAELEDWNWQQLLAGRRRVTIMTLESRVGNGPIYSTVRRERIATATPFRLTASEFAK
jgi:hypothetical protein